MNETENLAPQPLADNNRLELEDRSYVAPRNIIEKIVANIYEQLLQVERVSIYDDFFGLGGDSLLILQLVYELSQTFKIGLSQRSIAMEPMVVQVADMIVRSLTDQLDNEAVTEILAQMEELSEEEVENLLKNAE